MRVLGKLMMGGWMGETRRKTKMVEEWRSAHVQECKHIFY